MTFKKITKLKIGDCFRVYMHDKYVYYIVLDIYLDNHLEVRISARNSIGFTHTFRGSKDDKVEMILERYFLEKENEVL